MEIFKGANFKPTKQEISSFIRDNHALYGLDIKRLSTLLIHQLYYFHLTRKLDIFSITDEIKFLESMIGSRGTKSASKMRRPPLKGLWHKHFTDPMYIARNLINHWAFEQEDNNKYEVMLQGLLEKYHTNNITEEIVNEMTHKLVHEAYTEKFKANKVTGQWVIYSKSDNVNHYLSMGFHKEDDNDIRARIESICLKEYPFLKDILEPCSS